MHHAPPCLISAPFILTPSETLATPSSSPTLARDSALLVQDGMIQSVASLGELRQAHPTLQHIHHQDSFLTPGLVNAHCHLELSYMRNLIPPPPDFGDWVISLIRAYPAVEELEQVIGEAVGEGVRESLHSGVTTVGDISRHCTVTREALSHRPLRVLSFGEITALGPTRQNFAARLAAAANGGRATLPHGRGAVVPRFGGGNPLIGLSPHAPYTIEGCYLEQVIATAEANSLPLAMHLAEVAEEQQFLSSLTGALRKPYEYVAARRRAGEPLGDVAGYPGGPIPWARHFGLLSANVPVLLAHANYLTDKDLDILGRANAKREASHIPPLSIAYCPRTRTYFGHDAAAGPHRLLDLLGRGLNVCVATDSLASNPDLSLLREAQHLCHLRPELPLELLFEMMTVRGARALGLAHHTGSLAPQKSADVLAFALPPAGCQQALNTADLLTHLIQTAPAPTAVYLRGEHLLS